MTYQIINDETGRKFTFPSEAAYEAASTWYDTTDKSQIIEFCAAHGVVLLEPTDDPYFKDGQKLVDDWADAAMELYAQASAAA